MTRDWLTLLAAPGLGSATLRDLLRTHGGPANVLGAAPSTLRAQLPNPATVRALIAPDQAVLDRWESWLKQPGHTLIPIDDPAYPALLAAIPDPPLALFCAGDTDLLALPQLAIVGSRNATPAGLRKAREMSRALAAAGLTITSGLALGIDGAAHQGALDTDGLTIAVTANGLDSVYPARHRELAARIRERGLLVSEAPPGTAPHKALFPRRNRIISGLALGTLVVEASLRSGSLVTARLASEQGREVFAIPGSVDNPTARGCHRLIKTGAKLVEDTADILVELAPMLDNARVAPDERPPGAAPVAPEDEDYQRLLAHLDNAPLTIDTLVARTGLPVDAVSSMLLILELRGAVALAPGGGYQKLTTET